MAGSSCGLPSEDRDPRWWIGQDKFQEQGGHVGNTGSPRRLA